MKNLLLPLTLLFIGIVSGWASPILNVDHLGEQLGGWETKSERAADYERSGSKYRTWKPEVTPMMDGGIYISIRIDHIRGLFASDDHASLQIIVDKDGRVVQAQSSMAFQGQKITSDAIRLGASAGTTVAGVNQVAEVGTNLLADLSSKLLRENVAEPGRVTFPAVIHHNYNLLCLSLGVAEQTITEEATTDPTEGTPETPSPQPEEKAEKESKKQEEKPAKQSPLKLHKDKKTSKQIGQEVKLPIGS